MTTTPTLAHVIERAALSLAALATTGESAPGGARGARARDHRDRRDHGPGTWGKRRVPRPPGPPSDHFYMSRATPENERGSGVGFAPIRGVRGGSARLQRSPDRGTVVLTVPMVPQRNRRACRSLGLLCWGSDRHRAGGQLGLGATRRRWIRRPGPSRTMVPAGGARSAGCWIAAASQSLWPGSRSPSGRVRRAPCCARLTPGSASEESDANPSTGGSLEASKAQPVVVPSVAGGPSGASDVNRRPKLGLTHF